MDIETYEQDMVNMLVNDFTQTELEYIYTLFFTCSTQGDVIIRKLIGAENIKFLVRAIEVKRQMAIQESYNDILFEQEFTRFQKEMDALEGEEYVEDDYGVAVDYEGHDYQGRGW
jgi:hypothetical protein